MKKAEAIYGLLRIPLDALAFLAALLLSYKLRVYNIDLIPYVQLLETATTLPLLEEYIWLFVLPGLAAFVALSAMLGLYALRATLGGWQEIGRVMLAALLWLVCVIAWYFLVQKQLFYSRILLLHSTFFLILFVTLARSAVVLLQRALLRHGVGAHMVLTVGKQPVAQVALDTLEGDKRYMYLGHTGDLEGLKKYQARYQLDLVLQTDASPQGQQTVELIDFCRSHHIGYGFLPPVFADVPHQLEVDRLGLLPMMRFQPTPLDGWGRICKRIFDLVVSAAAIIILSPLLLVIALLILFVDGWPICYVSWRTGERGIGAFPMLKFRSMVRDAEAKKEELLEYNERNDGPLFKMKNDPRVTRLGKVLRRFDLDELPQLFNVFLGHMSLVGPRAHLPEEVERYKPYERRVFAVKPGITGLAQVSGRSDLSFEQEVHLDLQYVEEWSLLLDLWILWRTAWVVVLR